ncbi:LamG-like jellyroll fold domain-containing protein [Mangrovimonas sp. TPBH4]|uniref:LamG-like jellyroll fold domain-containing protein n=1 Tax=Mangrovimonas sp. TPBH4 TaxID=1645914 RepID=UPI0006B64BB1|nr:LamG-like jellyroll fold domain-containing protein [Mangrovimonas sp. TPBH4]
MVKKLHKKMILPAFFAASMLTANAQTGLSFDGSDDYIQTSFAGVLGTNNRTFEAWVYVPSDASVDVCILDYGLASGGSRNTFLIKADGQLKFVSGGTYGNIQTDINAVPFGAWTHVAFVLDNGTGYLYVNGVEEASTNLSNVNTPAGNDNVRIGNRVAGNNTPDLFFGGSMDEVRIWDVARSAEDIKSTMNTELCDDTAGMVAYYKFNDGIAGADNTGVTSVTDSVGGNDGTLNGFASSGATSNWVEGHGMVSISEATLTAAQTNSETTPTELVATYQWVDCNNDSAAIDGETGQTFTPEGAGNYAVEVTVDGCTTTSECIEVSSLGVEDVMFANNLKLYPNPTSGNVNVTLNSVYETVDAQLVSITGKVVATYQFSNTNEFSLDLNNFNSGLYFLNLKADHLDAATVKVVKM